MERKDITTTVERYLKSTNTDYKKDYQAVKSFMTTVEKDYSSYFSKLELSDLKDKIALRYLNLLLKNRELPSDNTPDSESFKWKYGYKTLLNLEKASSEQLKQEYKEEFETTLLNSNLDTKVVLLSMKIDSDRRLKAISTLNENDESSKTKSIQDCEYLNSSIEELNKHTSTIEELVSAFDLLQASLQNNLTNDPTLERKEQMLLYSCFTSRYRSLLQELESKTEAYDPNAPKYCLNNQLQQHLLHIIQVEDDRIEVLKEFCQDLEYRRDVFRTSPSAFNQIIKDFKIIVNLVMENAPTSTLVSAVNRLNW